MTLSDIDTSQVSFIAFWNAIDSGGVSDIDPTEVTSEPNIQDFTLEDNGVDITYQDPTLGHARQYNARVKEDGWFVVWIDRSATFAVNQGNETAGPWDVLNNWTRGGTAALNQNILERTINRLQAELSNSGSITYDPADVGLYNFEYPDATTMTVLAHDEGSDGSIANRTFQYTSSITRDYWVFVAACGGGDDTGENNRSASVVWQPSGVNVTMASDNGPGWGSWGARDLLDNGDIPDALTTYEADINTEDIGGFSIISGPFEAYGAHLALWR